MGKVLKSLLQYGALVIFGIFLFFIAYKFYTKDIFPAKFENNNLISLEDSMLENTNETKILTQEEMIARDYNINLAHNEKINQPIINSDFNLVYALCDIPSGIKCGLDDYGIILVEWQTKLSRILLQGKDVINCKKNVLGSTHGEVCYFYEPVSWLDSENILLKQVEYSNKSNAVSPNYFSVYNLNSSSLTEIYGDDNLNDNSLLIGGRYFILLTDNPKSTLRQSWHGLIQIKDLLKNKIIREISGDNNMQYQLIAGYDNDLSLEFSAQQMEDEPENEECLNSEPGCGTFGGEIKYYIYFIANDSLKLSEYQRKN